MTIRNFNNFLLFKLPSAFFCGVRLKLLSKERAVVTVGLNFLNKNPFKSFRKDIKDIKKGVNALMDEILVLEGKT